MTRRRKPHFIPTDDQRAWVRQRLAYGATQEQVWKRLGISEVTFRKHFKIEIDESQGDLDHEVVGYAMKLIREGCPAMTIFYLKARMGWRETQAIELTGKARGISDKPLTEGEFEKQFGVERAADMGTAKRSTDGTD